MAYNVLIVDDSAIVRKVLIKTFGLSGIEVNNFIQAGNGKEGLDALKANWVDVIFLDINMPVMNGMEFMKKLREDQAYKDTPVVVVSTEGSQERIEELQKAGIKSFLRKPVTPEHLVETIQTVLGGK
jgi:two-component system chemotaxis response regulator CheY